MTESETLQNVRGGFLVPILYFELRCLKFGQVSKWLTIMRSDLHRKVERGKIKLSRKCE